MDNQALVYADPEGTPHLVGHLWARMRKDRESATFEYDQGGVSRQWRGYAVQAGGRGPSSSGCGCAADSRHQRGRFGKGNMRRPGRLPKATNP